MACTNEQAHKRRKNHWRQCEKMHKNFKFKCLARNLEKGNKSPLTRTHKIWDERQIQHMHQTREEIEQTLKEFNRNHCMKVFQSRACQDRMNKLLKESSIRKKS